MYTSISYLIKVKSPEALQKAKELANEVTSPDAIDTRTMIAYPGGVERRETEHFRYGDFLEEVKIENENEDSFELTFKIRPFEERPKPHTSYWKDLIVHTIMRIGKATGATIEINRHQ